MSSEIAEARRLVGKQYFAAPIFVLVFSRRAEDRGFFFFSFSWIEVLEWGVWKCVGHWGGHSDIRALQIVSGQEQWLLNVL